MKAPRVCPYALAAVWMLAVAVWTQVVQPWWAIPVWFMAGMFVERTWHRVRVIRNAERRLREAEARQQLAASGCTCHARGGHPHDPDCVWWDRDCE